MSPYRLTDNVRVQVDEFEEGIFEVFLTIGPRNYSLTVSEAEAVVEKMGAALEEIRDRELEEDNV